ncbi:MAG: hypothetical protein HQ474_00300 [Flammeovirgaceae bacterium]|jgi:alpha-1,6-mannosyltransferase|nr:hypothetical protein [Flammeovirgaceae bacterium]|tara:strand:+ start:13443 stop:14732 length:1290 start_codon:yes stop_codon:yes gene_type:complete
MVLNRSQVIKFILSFLFLTSIAYLGIGLKRTDTLALFICFSSAYFAYFWICSNTLSIKQLLLLGVTARLILFWILPNLSDDFYRFLWDGQLIKNGISPYAILPTEAIELNLACCTTDALQLLNSPNYYSIYPPLNQFIFWLSSIVSSPLGAIGLIRILLLFADLGALFLINRLQPKSNHGRWLFLNPLLIWEGVGNVHFEPFVIFFILFFLYQLSKSNLVAAGWGWGLAMATKLVPLIFIPTLLFKFGWKNGGILIITGLTVFMVSMAPLLQLLPQSGFLSSLALYFNYFEFNASIYYLIRALGFWIKGYNIIGSLGPILGIFTALIISSYVLWRSQTQDSLASLLLFSLTIYLLMSTTVHPWYLLTLLPLGLLSGYWFPVLWSMTACWSYFGYTALGYDMPVSWVVAEYIILSVSIVFEIKRKYEKYF